MAQLHCLTLAWLYGCWYVTCACYWFDVFYHITHWNPKVQFWNKHLSMLNCACMIEYVTLSRYDTFKAILYHVHRSFLHSESCFQSFPWHAILCCSWSFTSNDNAKLCYASSVWWGFSTAGDIQRITAFIRRSIRQGCALRTLPHHEHHGYSWSHPIPPNSYQPKSRLSPPPLRKKLASTHYKLRQMQHDRIGS